MSVKIGREFPAKVIFERNVTVGDFTFLVIYGKHINGYFCCIPGKCGVEMSMPSNVEYNAFKLTEAGLPDEFADGIAEIIAYLGEYETRCVDSDKVR